jgi:protein gp37
MSDLFHEDVPDCFIKKVFGTMVRCPQHTFQVLTKRSGRLLQFSDELPWTPNIWMGVTIEDEENLFRADHLRGCGAKVKFLSCEPLLGPISPICLDGIDWVIVGGESGPNARPMRLEWVTAIRDLCLSAGIPYFFKQWGGWNKKATGRTLDGRVWDERPVLAQGLLPVF